MRPTNKETAKNRTSKLQKEIQKTIDQIGRHAFRNLLENYFGLEANESRKFVELIEDMNYFEPGYDTIPEDWYFDKIGPMSNKAGKLLLLFKKLIFHNYLKSERISVKQYVILENYLKIYRKSP